MKQKMLEDIILLGIVIDNKSFSAAARELGISKSIVSKRITRLEQNLKARLINRSTRQLALTQVGETLYEYSVRIREEIEEAERAVTHMQTEPMGTVKIHTPLSFGHLHLVPAIADFVKTYEDIKVDLSLGGSMMNLIEGGYDLGIYIGEPPDSNHICRRLAQRGMRVCASKHYLEKHGTPDKPEELKEHNCLVYREVPHHEVWQFQDKKGKDLFINIEGNLSATSAEALREAAVAGMGIVKLPGYMVTRQIKQGSLVPILDDYSKKDIGIYALYPHSRQLATKVRVFVDFLVERFEPESYWSKNNKT